MKLLEIRDNLGYYLDVHSVFVPIDKITKEDLLRLVDKTLNEDVEYDEYNGDAIKNQAHQILYKSVFDKLQGLKVRRKEFTDEFKRLYLQEYEWYKKK